MNGNDLSILLSARLNESESKSNIDADIKKLQAKLEKIQLKIEIDDRVLNSLNNFAKSIEKTNAVFEKQNETLKKFTTITKELDGSIKTVEQSWKADGTVIENTTTKIDKQTQSYKAQKQAINELIQSADNLASHTTKLVGGNQTGTTDVYKQGSITTTVNQSESAETRTTIKQNYESARVEVEKLKQAELDYWSLRRKEAVASLTAENSELVKMRDYYTELEKESERVFNLGEKKNISLFTGTDKDSIERYAKELYGAEAQVVKFGNEVKKGDNVVRDFTVRLNKNANEYTEIKMKADTASKSVSQFGDAINRKTGKDMGVFEQFRVAMERFPEHRRVIVA